jgi:predicted P-loop ATPase
MVVLEGEQGMLKSSALKILGGPWFSDTLPDIRQPRETSQHLRGKWIIEIGELAAISHAQSERLKAFLTHRTERYLPRYAHNEVEEPRQCVFVGTTNRDSYLSDETGGRRFWPIKTGDILLQALEEDRDQLFAEACVRYDAGKPWWPDPAWEARHIKPEQEARFETDPWEDAVLAHVNAKMPDSDGVTRVQISEIARTALGADATFRVATKDQRRIAAILIRHGWKAGHDERRRFYAKYLG